MKSKYYKKRIVFVEVGDISFALPKNFEVKDIPMFLNSKEFEALIDSKKIHKVIDEDSSFTQKELEIFEERDSSVWKPGSSHLIEDYESLEKYMSDINHNPKLMGSSFYESFMLIRNYKEFITYYRTYPLNSYIFSKYIELLVEQEPDYFRNQTSQYFLECSVEFLESLNQNKEISYNYDFYGSHFADSPNPLGNIIEPNHLTWLYLHGNKTWNEKETMNVLNQLTILIDHKQIKKLEFLIKNDPNIKSLLKEKLIKHPNVAKSIFRLLEK